MSTARTLAKMAGSSIATRAGRAWIKDFLNAAFYARSPDSRSVDDLRLAHAILNTRWARRRRRLGARELRAFHSAFGASRARGLGRLDHEALLAGGADLIGEWFPGAWVDPERRAYGIAFETSADRDEFDPALRLRHGRLGELTPPGTPAPELVWETYPPVPIPDPDAALALLLKPGRWPDIGSSAGRFTPVRHGGLDSQTFEIELAMTPAPRALLNTRGYVTCTGIHRGVGELRNEVETIGEHVDTWPDQADPIALIELTTHEGHFLGSAISRLLLFAVGGDAYIRDIGCWDPLPKHLAAAYAAGGRAAQQSFWGPEDPEASMLRQLAEVTS